VSATPCAFPPPWPSIFSNYSFWVHHLVNLDDRQILAHAMASDFSVARQCLSKRTIGVSLRIKLHALSDYFVYICMVETEVRKVRHLAAFEDPQQEWIQPGIAEPLIGYPRHCVAAESGGRFFRFADDRVTRWVCEKCRPKRSLIHFCTSLTVVKVAKKCRLLLQFSKKTTQSKLSPIGRKRAQSGHHKFDREFNYSKKRLQNFGSLTFEWNQRPVPKRFIPKLLRQSGAGFLIWKKLPTPLCLNHFRPRTVVLSCSVSARRSATQRDAARRSATQRDAARRSATHS
jgi:hypothetical protein